MKTHLQIHASSRRAGRRIFRPDRRGSAGFSLMTTLLLMVLLAVVAVGLLGLASVSIRSGAQSLAIAEAQANARLALMLAIGELQKHAGPDQRITATGGILAENAANPHWVGVWDSWKAGAETSAGDPPSAHATIAGNARSGMAPGYDASRSKHFRKWLVSDASPGASLASEELAYAATREFGDAAMPKADASSVTVVSGGSLHSPTVKDKVKAGLVAISKNAAGNPSRRTGRYGWWVGDESTKARIKDDPFRNGPPLSNAAKSFRLQSPGRAGLSQLPGFDKIPADAELGKVMTRQSLRLLDGAGAAVAASFHDASPYPLGLLTDVREGGLKRDLSTILERPINLNDKGDPFMLYRFDNAGQEQVPIQDLAAYYQLYRTQLKHSSAQLRGGLQVNNPDFGSGGQAFTREYTSLYRQPIPIRVQFLLSLLSAPRTPAEIAANPNNKDTHKLHIGITPALTFWNPNNVPLAMNLGPDQANQFRFFNLPFTLRWTKEGKGYTSSKPASLAWLSRGIATGGDRDTGFTLFTSGTRPIVFEPGQVRVFSLANTGLTELRNSDTFKADREVVAGWNPSVFIRLQRSDPSPSPLHVDPPSGGDNSSLTFSAGDRLSFVAETINTSELANGTALQFFLRQSSVGGAKDWVARHFQLTSRLLGSNSSFNVDLMKLSYPGGKDRIQYEARAGNDIIRSTASGVGLPFMMVSLAAGCETHESGNQGPYAGRSFASRPFLHSSPITGTVFIDRADHDAAYHHGWNWWVQDISSVFDANISVSARNEGYYGGGFSPEAGTTHVVQQEIPAVPPLSIAALSHAHLGGFSLANERLGPSAEDTTTNFQRVTASGQGGLFPHTVRAIGNSYAHPYLRADQAFGKWTRQYSQSQPAKQVTLADHSYLANKALWDEFFFSSITPTSTEFFTSSERVSPLEKARRFFSGDEKLPNRRFVPYSSKLAPSDLNAFFTAAGGTPRAETSIAAHLMVEGAFNVNSTSVEAWKSVFASLRGEEVMTVSSIGRTQGAVLSGTPALGVSLPSGKPAAGGRASSDLASWTGGRELSDAEIVQLAAAMVKEVRRRGPFLSLSEFVNRRLDLREPELSAKGALQAALDAPEVDINKAFREPSRRFTPDEIKRLKPAFKEALEGPVAYGSSAYVNQADILRGLAEQLTPRGDTFIIRSYGDSISPDGRIAARVWCEAVVQRIPDYLDPADEAQVRHDELKSISNKKFGRRFQIISLRYLLPSEI